MKIEFNIPMKAYSVNAMYYKDLSDKKVEARNWETCILEHLRNPNIQEKLEKIRSIFKKEEHHIHVELTTYYPEEVFFTQKNYLNNKTFDITNIEKPLVDVLFLKKYCTSLCKNLQIDDRYISKMRSEKAPANKHMLVISIEIKDLQSLPSTRQF